MYGGRININDVAVCKLFIPLWAKVKDVYLQGFCVIIWLGKALN